MPTFVSASSRKWLIILETIILLIVKTAIVSATEENTDDTFSFDVSMRWWSRGSTADAELAVAEWNRLDNYRSRILETQLAQSERSTESERFVSVYMPPREGFNNQRQALCIAIVIARALNRTLLVPPFLKNKHVSNHSPRQTPAWRFFDTHDLAKATKIKQAVKVYPKVNQNELVEINYKPRVPINLTDLIDKYADSTSKLIVLNKNMYWSYIAYQFKGNEAIAVKELLRTRFHFNESVVSSALFLAKETLKGRFLAVHVRLGDREPWPLVNCSHFGLAMERHRVGRCVSYDTGMSRRRAILAQEAVLKRTKSLNRPGLSIVDVLKRMIDEETPRSVFIATNRPDNEKVVGVIRSTLEERGIDPFFWSDLQPASLRKDIEERGDMAVSVAEQIICAYAQMYLGTFPSSWDELVVYIRSWLQLPGSQELLSTFESRILHMLAHDISRTSRYADHSAAASKIGDSASHAQNSGTNQEDYS